jgi:NADH:ubiquinone oxidoreductase subunit E
VAVDLRLARDLCQEHVRSDHSLVMLLQDVQGRYGYLPREVLKAISREIQVPLARLYGLATFYRSFALSPRGRHEVTVCTGTACHVRGAAILLQHLQRRLNLQAGQTSPDGEFTLVTVNCLGACALGPLMVVDGKYHGKMTLEKSDGVLAKLKAAEERPKA